MKRIFLALWFLLFLGITIPARADLTDDLYRYLKFDENISTQTFDEIVMQNYSIETFDWDDGVSGSGLRLDYTKNVHGFHLGNDIYGSADEDILISLSWWMNVSNWNWYNAPNIINFDKSKFGYYVYRVGGLVSHRVFCQNDSFYEGIKWYNVVDFTSTNEWHFYNLDFNGTYLNLYIDDVYIVNVTCTNSDWDYESGGYYIGGYKNNQYPNVTIDEFGWWNRSLTYDERIELYSNGSGTFYPFAPPEVFVYWQDYSPLNNSVMSYFEPIFFNHSSVSNLNCSLWKNITKVIEYGETPEGLVGFWRFEEGNGSVAIDSSVSGNNGTIFGAVYNSSKSGNGTGSYALNFDGIDDYVDYGNIHNFERNDTFSIMAWFKTDIAGNQEVICKRDPTGLMRGYTIQMGTAGQFHFGLFNDNSGGNRILESTVATGFADNIWHHLALTYDGSSSASGLKFYIDGVNQSTTIITDSLTATIKSNAILSVGSRNGSALFWDGLIDEDGIFNRTLNDSEVLDHYNNGINITQQNISSGFTTIQNLTNVSGNVKQNFSDYVLSNGFYELYVSCDNVNSSHKFITVNGTTPSIDFLKIKNFYAEENLSDGGVYEFADGEWNLSVNVSFQNFFKMSLHNNSGLEQSQDNDEMMSVDSGVFESFVLKNPFNVSVFANNSFGESFSSILFYVNDTVLPMCVGTLSDIGVDQGSTFVWAVNCSDELFFSWNISCDNGFSFYEDNINNQSYFFNGSTAINNHTVCLYEFCDGHTKSKIDDFKIKKDLENKTLEVQDKKLKFAHSLKNIELKKKFDRYEFCVEFESVKKLDFSSVVIPDGCFHIESDWSGHLVCPDKRIWFDFVNPDVKVSVVGNTVYLDLRKVKGNRVCFDSVGEFNCDSGSQVIGLLPPDYTKELGREFESIPQALYHIFLLIFWFLIVIVVFTVKGGRGDTIQLLNILQMAVGIVAGIMFFKFSFMVGFPVLFTAIGIFVGLNLHR